jgi:bacillithiol system protein YtxJ
VALRLSRIHPSSRCPLTVHFTDVPDVTALSSLFQVSHESPVILYLHDPYCGLSALAHAQVSQLDGEVALIDVHSNHDLSMEVERITGVCHESPQLLILNDGQAVWSASHRRVTAPAIEQALARLNGEPEPEATDGRPAEGWLRRLLRPGGSR